VKKLAMTGLPFDRFAWRGEIIPSGVLMLDLTAFRDLPTGTHLDRSPGVRAVRLCPALRSIPADFFAGCAGLQEVNTGDCLGLESMGQSCFCECYSLEELAFPPSLQQVEICALMETSVETVDLGAADQLKNFGAFGMQWLRKLTLPRGVFGITDYTGAARLVDFTGTMRALPSYARLRRLRAVSLDGWFFPRHGPAVSTAEAFAEMAAAAGRPSLPFLPR
jgi:hypothetical protein